MSQKVTRNGSTKAERRAQRERCELKSLSFLAHSLNFRAPRSEISLRKASLTVELLHRSRNACVTLGIAAIRKLGDGRKHYPPMPEQDTDCFFGAGPERSPAKAKSFCSQARPASENRGSPPRCWNASPMSRTRVCATFAPHSTRTARFIQSSVTWNGLPASGTMTHRK